MSDIPSEFFREILLRSSAESLLRFRAVCKAWRRLIDDPSFVKSHTNNNNHLSDNTLLIRKKITGLPLCLISLESLNFNIGNRQTIDAIPVEPWIRNNGACGLTEAFPCHGLMLLSGYAMKNDKFSIWNPLTRECRDLPSPPKSGTYECFAGIGLGYDYAADDYRVVKVDNLELGQGSLVFRTSVYSLKLGSWRVVTDCPYNFTDRSKGVFLNGALHWKSRDIIIVFDIGTECYRHLPLPPVQLGADLCKVHLDVLGGCLTVSYYYRRIQRVVGWVMNDYVVGKSWMKLFSIRERDIVGFLVMLKPVAYLNDKKKILLQNERAFFVVDVEDKSVKKVTIHGHLDICRAQVCPGSLFRLRNDAANRTPGVKTEEKYEGCTRLTFCVRDVDD